MTRDEAIAEALTEVEPGSSVVVHEHDCLFTMVDDGGTYTCTCNPTRWMNEAA